jgi:hypothetical protein
MKIREFKNAEKWADEQWGKAKLGDQRRAERAVKVGSALAELPSASLPEQFPEWKDLKAAYRLFNQPEATFTALSQPHWELTQKQSRDSTAEVVLFVQDKSDLDFSHHPATEGLGHVGKFGRGMLLQSCLAIVPQGETPQILGMAGQRVWLRTEAKRKGRETRSERLKRQEKESEVWAAILKQIGPAPLPGTGHRSVSVGDRESDIFSYVRQAQEQWWDVLLRVAQNRTVVTPEDEREKLLDYARSLSPQTTKKVTLRGRDGKPKRKVKLKVAFSPVKLCAPQQGPERGQTPISGWVVRCWAEGEEDLEWVLFTTVPVKNAKQAKEILQWYEFRWVIEEYHKCLKTGCAMEKRQLETASRLQALLGFLAVIAVRLLQLREMSRIEPERLAIEVAPQLFVQTVKQRLSLKPTVEEMTVREFYHAVARLGGFIGRKSDGDPGWQTLWRGWERLQDLSWRLETLPVP